MTFIQYKRAVGVFSNSQQAESALTDLRNSGFPMDRVSLVAKDTDRRDVAGVGVSDRPGDGVAEGAKTGAVTGGVVGGLVGLIGSLTALTVPGVGPVVAGGTIASILGDTLVGGAIGAATGGLIGALVGLGIPEERARVYNDRVSRGDYLVMVEGTEEEISRAQTILQDRGIQEWGIYDATAGEPRSKQHRALGVFTTRSETEAALEQLRDAGFPMNKVSAIARDADRDDEIAGVDVKDPVGNKADEGAATGAVTGGALGGITGLLVGLGALAIPGVGPIMLAGAGATALATTLAGTALGAAAGGLIGALAGMGIPEDRARIYSDRVARGDYLVIVDGTEEEIRRAENILAGRGIQEWGVYDRPATDIDRADSVAPGTAISRTEVRTDRSLNLP